MQRNHRSNKKEGEEIKWNVGGKGGRNRVFVIYTDDDMEECGKKVRGEGKK